MRKVLMTCMALLGVPVGPLLAQPAAPGGSGAAAAPGGTGAAPSVLPDTASPGGMTGLRPMRGQPKQAVGMNHFTRKPPGTARTNTKHRGGRATPASAAGDDADAPRTGRAGSLGSTTASNITLGDTRSEAAPRLAARRALATRDTASAGSAIGVAMSSAGS